MIRTELAERILLIVLVAGVGLNELFHAIFDGLQFMFNVEFVGTVLSMESTFEPGSWRAIESPVIACIAYTLIWAAHALSGIFCLAGSYLGQNNELMAAEARFNRISLQLASNTMYVENPDLVELNIRARNNEEATEAEAERLGA